MTRQPVTLINRHGRKYLTPGERERFLLAAQASKKPEHRTFALTLAHSGARISEALALRLSDIDAAAGAIRISTLKRRGEHWREVPLPDELLRELELVHGPGGSPPAPRHRGRLWPWSRVTGYRRIAAVMERAGIIGPQACPKGLRHAFGIACVTAGVPLPTISAALGHSALETTAIYTTAVGGEAREFLGRLWSRTSTAPGPLQPEKSP